MAMKKATRKKSAKTVSKKRKKAAKAPNPEALMAAWQKVMTPADSHRRLEPLVGTFQARTTITMQLGADPHVSEGKSEHRWILGGRFVEQHYRSSMMGMPFEGVGFTGYDNAAKRYVGSWMDTAGTGIMNSCGTGKPSDKEIKTIADSYDPSGKRIWFDCKIRIQDRDHHSFEMWTKAPSGKRYRTMLVEYTRV